MHLYIYLKKDRCSINLPNIISTLKIWKEINAYSNKKIFYDVKNSYTYNKIRYKWIEMTFKWIGKYTYHICEHGGKKTIIIDKKLLFWW